MTVAAGVKQWRFSATAAEMASDCLFAFSQKYELGVEEIPGRPLQVGRLLSETIERYQAHCFDQKVPSDITEIANIARAVYAEKGQGIPLDVLDEVLRACDFYVEAFNVDIDRIAGAEMWLPPRGMEPLVFAGREVIGKVDQLLFEDEGRLAIVVDQKSNWSVWSEREAAEKLQARLYPILVMHSFPDVEEVEVRFQFVRHGIERVVRVGRGEAYLERQKLDALAQLMQRPGPRPATPGERCSYCGYVSRCPVFRAARESGVFAIPTNEEEARKVVETVLVLEAALKQRRQYLNTYTNEHGPIEVKGVRIGHFETRRLRVRTPAFRAWSKDNGVEADEWLEVPARDLERLLKKRPSLRPLLYEETDTRFGDRRSEEAKTTAA